MTLLFTSCNMLGSQKTKWLFSIHTSDFNHAMLGKMKVQEKLDPNLFMGVGKRICCFFK